MGYFKELLPKMAGFYLTRSGLSSPSTPLNLTFSVTNICQSRCKTCQIWDLYKKAPQKRSQELTTPEIKKIFMRMGHVYVFNVSGGEPFLRPDFPEIIKLACTYLTPGIIHIPTNCIAEQKIKKQLSEILPFLKDNAPGVRLTIKPSLDHIGEKHDEIRGAKGNFKKVIRVFEWLKAQQAEYLFLHAELGTVISAWNVKDIQEISRYVQSLNPDSYRNEIAEERSEMFNKAGEITPRPSDYDSAIRFFVHNVKSQMHGKPLFQRITHSFRLTYYDLAVRIMKEQRQVIPCFAGISNAHMTPYGDIWACCTLGYDQSMGNLKEFDYDFKKLWGSDQAKKVRSFIKNKNCHCPLANQSYSNILMDPVSLGKTLRSIIIPRL